MENTNVTKVTTGKLKCFFYKIIKTELSNTSKNNEEEQCTFLSIDVNNQLLNIIYMSCIQIRKELQ